MSRHFIFSVVFFISPMLCLAQSQPAEALKNGTNGFQPNHKPLLQIQRVAASGADLMNRNLRRSVILDKGARSRLIKLEEIS